MEKRLLLAVVLSLAVVFLFQSFFGVKAKDSGIANITANSILSSNTTTPTISEDKIVSKSTIGKVDFAEVVNVVSAGNLTFTISNIGGTIKKIHLNDYDYDFPITQVAEIDLFSDKPFSFSKVNKNTFLLAYQNSEINVQKQVSVDKYKYSVNYRITNLSGAPVAVTYLVKPFDLDLSRLDSHALSADWTLFEYAVKTEKNIQRKEQVNKFNDKWNKSVDIAFDWISFRDRYFVTIVELKDFFKGYSTQALNEKGLAFSATIPSTIIQAGKTQEYSFTVFSGPQRLDVLKDAQPGFEKVLVFSSWGWLDVFAKGIYWLLGAIHHLIPVWGLCIIIVSILIYGGMYPLTLKSMTSMKKMQALQPKMAQLKIKFKDSPEKLNKEIVELYRVNSVNPVSGCLPMLLQMPIFIGLYQVLWRSIYFRGESFLWMKDLSMPDRLFKLPFNVPFVGEYFNILPILMIFIMLGQQIITLKNMVGGDPEQVQQQKIMAIIFPIFLGVIFYNFASGLNLYFVVFYFFSALSQWYISKDVKAAA